MIQCDHLLIGFYIQSEEINKSHQQVSDFFISIQLCLNTDGIQCVVQEVRIDLTFQIQHGHFLLDQFCTQFIRVFQNQIESHCDKSDSHAADQPRRMQPLNDTYDDFYQQSCCYGTAGNQTDLFMMPYQHPDAQGDIECNTDIAQVGMNSIRIVSLRSHCIVNWKGKNSGFKEDQKESCDMIQECQFSRVFLNQVGHILVEQIFHDDQSTDKQPVYRVV